MKVVTPLNYLNGSLVAVVNYSLSEREGYAHTAEINIVTSLNQYLPEVNKYWESGRVVGLATGDEIRQGINELLDYLAFLRDFLETHREHPPLLEGWRMGKQS